MTHLPQQDPNLRDQGNCLVAFLSAVQAREKQAASAIQLVWKLLRNSLFSSIKESDKSCSCQ